MPDRRAGREEDITISLPPELRDHVHRVVTVVAEEMRQTITAEITEATNHGLAQGPLQHLSDRLAKVESDLARWADNLDRRLNDGERNMVTMRETLTAHEGKLQRGDEVLKELRKLRRDLRVWLKMGGLIGDLDATEPGG